MLASYRFSIPSLMRLRFFTQSWCSTGHNCTPALDRYIEKVEPMLAMAPRGTKGNDLGFLYLFTSSVY